MNKIKQNLKVARQNPVKGVCFHGCYIKVGNLEVLYKTDFEGDPETIYFGSMQLSDLRQPEDQQARQYQMWRWINGPPIWNL